MVLIMQALCFLPKNLEIFVEFATFWSKFVEDQDVIVLSWAQPGHCGGICYKSNNTLLIGGNALSISVSLIYSSDFPLVSMPKYMVSR